MRPGGIRPRVSVAVVVPRPVGVLHLAVPHHRERRHGSAARQRGARRAPSAPSGCPRRSGRAPRRIRAAGRTGSRRAAEQRERIRQALDALPPKARTIIMLSDVEGSVVPRDRRGAQLPHRDRDVAGCITRASAQGAPRADAGRCMLVAGLEPSTLGAVVRAQPIVRVRRPRASRPPRPPPPSRGARAPRHSGRASPRLRPGTAPEPETDERLRSAFLPAVCVTLFRYTDYTTPRAGHAAEGPAGHAAAVHHPGRPPARGDAGELQRPLRSACSVRLLRGEQPEVIAQPCAPRPAPPRCFGGPPARQRRAHHHPLGDQSAEPLPRGTR